MNAAASTRAVERRFPGRRLVQPLLARLLARCCFLRSSALGGRPVRPRASIVPAALPRCLVRRLRFVWAIVSCELTRVRRGGERVFDRRVAAQRRGRRESRRTPPRGASPTSSARRRRAWRATAATTVAERRRAVVLDVGRDLGRPPRARATARSRARPAGPPAPPSRIARGDRPGVLRASAGGASSTLKATSGGRAATSTAPAVGCRRARAEVGRELAGLRSGARAPPGRPRRSSRAGAAAGRARRRGTPAARARRRAGRRARAPRRTRRRGRARTGRRSARRRAPRPADGRRRGCRASIRSSARAAPRERPPAASSPGSPASVNALRWWSGSEWTSSRPVAERAPRSRRSIAAVAALGDVRVREQRGHARVGVPRRARSGRRRAPAAVDRQVASSTTTSRWIGTDTVPPIPALAPNATWTVPRIFSSSSTLPVSRARSLVPTPSSARLRAELAVRAQQLEVLRARARPRPRRCVRPRRSASPARRSDPSGARLDGDDRARRRSAAR